MAHQKIFNKSIKYIWQKWSVAFKVTPVVLVVALLKFFSHHFGLEIMELNALFTSLVAGTIFLIGFLITGVFSDYKESEKIPSELTACLKSLFDDAYTIYKSRNSVHAQNFLAFQKSFTHSLMDWFYKRERTKSLLEKIRMMNDFFIEIDKENVPAPYIAKMKNDQGNIRKIILRIKTVRDTNFISSAYAIVEAMGFLVALGLIIMKIEPFYASLFFTILVTFLITYMLFLIKDLDNPFDYSSKGETGTEISLKPLRDHEASLSDLL